jgi:multicomponent Na+:H+ antiporter subunit B
MTTRQRMREKPVLRIVAKRFIPFVLLFGLYVQFHGDFGPGGGFQAGVIFAAGLILYAMIFGVAELKKVLPPRIVELGVALGVVLYAGVGFASIALGGAFLDYQVFTPHHPSHGQHLGITLVELGVGITVTSVMTTIYYSFASREQ